MEVEKESVPKVRLTLDLSLSLNEELERMGRNSGKTKAELMRLALDFLLRAEAAKHQDNMTVGAWKDDKENKVRVEREFTGVP
jgi:hypothetical protein